MGFGRFVPRLAALAGAIVAWRWVWQRLWDWSLSGMLERWGSYDEAWFGDPFLVIGAQLRTILLACLVAGVAALVAYGLTRFLGWCFGRKGEARPEAS
jgi:hypothetical protein